VRIALAYDQASRVRLGDPGEVVSAEWSLGQVEQVERALGRLGHEPVRLPLEQDLAAFLRAAERCPVELVVNLVQSNHCSHVARLLEALGRRYTGSGPLAIDLTTDKALSKDVLCAHGVPVPAYRAVYRTDEWRDHGLAYPLIVKPLEVDNSLGIGPDSIVAGEAALARQTERVLAAYGAAVIEEFVDGRELLVSLQGNGPEPEALPICEAGFDRFPPGMARIYDFASKWEQPGSGAELIDWTARADLAPAAEAAVLDACRRACRVLGCRDYARVDLRLDREGVPRVLEVNTNPDVHPRAGYGASALESGRTFEQLVADLIAIALAAPADERAVERM